MKKVGLLAVLLLILSIILYQRGLVFGPGLARLVDVPARSSSSDRSVVSGPTGILKVELLEQDFWGAWVEVTYRQGDDQRCCGYLSVKNSPEVGRQYHWPARLKRGEHTEKFYIHRYLSTPEAYSTQQISIVMYMGGEWANPFYSELVDLPLQWPNTYSLYKEVDNPHADPFAGVDLVYLPISLPHWRSVREDLLKAGLPPEKLVVYQAQRKKSTGLLLSEQLPLAGVQVALGLMKKYKIPVNYVDFTDTGRTPPAIMFSVGLGYETLGMQSSLDELLNSKLNEREFYELLNHDWADPKARAAQLVSEAKNSIDSQNRSKSIFRQIKNKLDRALELDPTNTAIYIELARYHIYNDRNFTIWQPTATGAHALALLQSANKLSPDDTDVLVLLGHMQNAQGYLDEAMATFDRAEKLGTDNWWLWNNRAVLYRKLDQIDMAVAMYQEVAGRERPNNKNDRVMDNAFRELATLYEQQGEIELADEIYSRHHRLFPRRGQCMYRRHATLLLRHTDDVERAEGLARTSNQKRCNAAVPLAHALYRRWAKSLESDGQESLVLLAQAAATYSDKSHMFYEFAVSDKSHFVLDALLARGDSIDSEDPDGNTALTRAVWNGDSDAARALLARGADPNNIDREGQWPLLAIAVSRQEVEIVKLLLDKGAKPERESSLGFSTTQLAEEIGNQEIIDLLQSKRSRS